MNLSFPKSKKLGFTQLETKELINIILAQALLSLEVYEAKTKEKLRIELAEANGGKNPTVDALNNALVSTKAYQAFRKRHIEAMKTRDFVSSTFWSAKDKSAKLDELS